MNAVATGWCSRVLNTSVRLVYFLIYWLPHQKSTFFLCDIKQNCFESVFLFLVQYGVRMRDEGPHPTVEAVERWMEVEPETQAIHFQKHLSQKQPQENKLCIVYRWGNKNSNSIRGDGGRHDTEVVNREQDEKPTEEDGQPVGLVVVDDGHTDGVESHQAEHHQVESVRLHHPADGDAQHALFAAQVGSGAAPAAAEVHPRSWHTWERRVKNHRFKSKRDAAGGRGQNRGGEASLTGCRRVCKLLVPWRSSPCTGLLTRSLQHCKWISIHFKWKNIT